MLYRHGYFITNNHYCYMAFFQTLDTYKLLKLNANISLVGLPVHTTVCKRKKDSVPFTYLRFIALKYCSSTTVSLCP